MEWQFRKTLESFDFYRNNSQSFITEVDKGTPNVLKTLVRQIQLIMSDSKADKISKVLAMRFAKDLMIMGREDVIKQLTKLVPHILKICSHRLESDDPNRGQTLFYDDEEYIHGSKEQKQQLQTYGATYFTLCLQSIYHWAKWIPLDTNNNESIYARGFHTLLERGVKYQPIFHYYKNSDTEKFKNTYRVEFFSESSFNLNSYEESMRDSQCSKQQHLEDSIRSSIKDQGPITVSTLKNSLNLLESRYLKSRKPEQKQKIKEEVYKLSKSAFDIYENHQKSPKKSDYLWLMNFIALHTLQKSKRISYQTFLNRCNDQNNQIMKLSVEEQAADPTIEKNFMKSGTFKKKSVSAKRQQSSGNNDKEKYEIMFQEQEDAYRREVQFMKRNLESKEKQLRDIKRTHQKQIQLLKTQSEERIKNIKENLSERNAEAITSERMGIIERQNQILTAKVLQNQECIKQNFHLKKQIDELLYEIEKLQSLKMHHKQTSSADDYKDQRIYELEMMLAEKSPQQEITVSQDELRKKNKKIQSFKTEVNLYKKSLADEREHFQFTMKSQEAKIVAIEQQVKDLKEQNLYLQKKIDLKDIQIEELTEQIKLCKLMDRETNLMLQNIEMEREVPLNRSPNEDKQAIKTPSNPKRANKRYKFELKKYEDFRNSFIGQKQRYLRLIRCCLKKKDLLMKQNQLQLGLISEVVSGSQLKITLFITNFSEQQIENLEIAIEYPPSSNIQVQLSTSFVFCIPQQEQEKVIINYKNEGLMKSPYDPTYLQLKFQKRGKHYEYRLALPFIFYKTLEFYPQNQASVLIDKYRQSMSLNYSKNILPDIKTLFSYFPNLQETGHMIYECEIFQRDINFRAHLKLELSGQNFMIISLTPIIRNQGDNFGFVTPKQTKIIQQILSFYELAFRR